VGQVARPIRSQPDVVEANGFPCRDERPSPQDPLWIRASRWRGCSI
jgi:hypothetical protein